MNKSNIFIISAKVFITILFYFLVYLVINKMYGFSNYFIIIPYFCYLALDIILTLKKNKIILIIINILDILIVLLSVFVLFFLISAMHKAPGEAAMGLFLFAFPLAGVFYGILSLNINNFLNTKHNK